MKRWPIVRHVRYLLAVQRATRSYQIWMALGYYPLHIERDIIAHNKIWFGRE